MKNNIINELRKKMSEKNISVYIVPTSDFHDSEYVLEYFNTRKFLSGFTGSAGTLVVTLEEASLFTDGRYFVQAEKQLKGTNIKLMKMGEKDVLDINEYIKINIKDNSNVGVDGRVVSYSLGKMLSDMAKAHNGKLIYEYDLPGELWKDRPDMIFNPLWILEDTLSGEGVVSKLSKIRAYMKNFNTDAYFVTSLDDIAWIFNIRGKDIPNNPVVFSFAIIYNDYAELFIGNNVISKKDEEILKAYKVYIKEYNNIYEEMDKVREHRILLQADRVNYKLVNILGKNNRIINGTNPSTKLKAIKNQTEISNTKKVHILDGVAVTKFMYWLKNNAGKITMTEKTASDYIDNLRSNIEGFLDLSFDTISAYNENGAMMHYNSNTGNNANIINKGSLLVDSGGQYTFGTTDITRTFVLGEVTEEFKKHFTTVAMSMLRLLNTIFLHGCTGINLDIIAREPLWSMGIDYKCGTGHGVGHILNVHEGPNNIRWQIRDNVMPATLEEGMITTDEPGVYISGKYGIRTENELLCKEAFTTDSGTFMEFDNLTFAPIDLDGIDIKYMEKKDVDNLNRYHKKVYEAISPYLNEEEVKWLMEYTKNI